MFPPGGRGIACPTMLQAIPFYSRREKQHLLKTFNPQTDLWVCADTKSCHFILDHLQQKQEVLNTDCVSRAKDLWQFLVKIQKPPVHFLPRDHLTILYQKWAGDSWPHQPWRNRIHTGHTLCDYMELFSHLLSHPERDELMEQWLEAGRSSYLRQWYELARGFWDWLQKKHIASADWCASLLVDQVPTRPLRDRRLIFDLGLDMDPVEADLVNELSRSLSVKVLVPITWEQGRLKPASRFYEPLLTGDGWSCAQEGFLPKSSAQKNSAQKRKATQQSLRGHIPHRVRCFSSPVAEVKDITSWAGRLLNQEGANPRDIAVLCPHIEEYWPTLKPYLKEEGVPVSKREGAGLASFPRVALWRAGLKAHLSLLQYSDLELLKSNQHPGTDFSRFEALYTHTRDTHHLPKYLLKKHLLQNKDQPLTAGEFVTWCLKLYPPEEDEGFLFPHIKNVLSDLLEQGGAIKESLRAKNWLQILESLLKNHSVILNEEGAGGIQCLSLNALGGVNAPYVYIAGLSEQGLKSENPSLASEFDFHSLRDDLGFLLKLKPLGAGGKSVLQFMERGGLKNLTLSFARFDFQGQALTPSYLWLRMAREKNIVFEQTHSPGDTLWDKARKLPEASHILARKKENKTHAAAVEQALKTDRGLAPLPLFTIKPLRRLSASLLEDYFKCPFITASKHLFKLSEDPLQDVDLPVTQRGSLVHKLFERLKQKPAPCDPEGVLSVIEDLKREYDKKLAFLHPLMWENQKQFLLQRAMAFLEHEKQNQNFMHQHKLPVYKTLKRELVFECYWDKKTGSLCRTGDIPFKGIIDRVDFNGEDYRLVDYKASMPVGAGFRTWESSGRLQMALYIQAVEGGLTDLEPKPVRQVLYLSYRDFQYRGMAFKGDFAVHLLGSRSHSFVSEEKKKQTLLALKQQTQQMVLNMEEGHFAPRPHKESHCETCRWRTLCRLPSLN